MLVHELDSPRMLVRAPRHFRRRQHDAHLLLAACRMQNPTYTVQVAPDFPIQVHEGNSTVTVQAGVTQRILLNYLAAYMCAPALCSPWVLRQDV